jgi:hypothetical protein
MKIKAEQRELQGQASRVVVVAESSQVFSVDDAGACTQHPRPELEEYQLFFHHRWLLQHPLPLYSLS